MCEYVADIDDLPSILDHRDQPVFVAANVEDREPIHGVGVRKIRTDIDQMFPGGSFRYAVPVQQGFDRIFVHLNELRDRCFTDDPHYSNVTKTVTTAQDLPAAAWRGSPRH